MAVFFYAGIALVAIGSLFIMVNVGGDTILFNSTFGMGVVFFGMGAVLTVLAAPYKKKEEQKLIVSRQQLTVAVLVVGSFFLVFFLVYPGGLLRSYSHVENEDSRVVFDGLKSQYRVGDRLAFSMQIDGYFDENAVLPQTSITRLDDGSAIWIGTGILRTPLQYADNPDVIVKEIYVGGTFQPLILENEGVYEIIVEGDNVGTVKKQFTVVARNG